MRTTVTLDDDVLARVQDEMRRTGHSFKRALNDLVRRASDSLSRGAIKPFVVRPRHLRLPPGASYDNVEELLDRLDGPQHA